MSDTLQLRDALRAKIFDGKNTVPQSKIITFFGVDIELRQPTLSNILAQQKNEDRESAVIETLISHAYVPGTDEHVFVPEDLDQLLVMPFGEDFVAVSNALEEISKVNFRDKPATSETGADPKAGDEASLGAKSD